MNKEITFLVQGSEPEPYTVVFEKRRKNITTSCTCQAGSVWGIHCKHRLNILKGQTGAIVSDNQDEVQTIVQWLEGSDIQEALLAIDEVEKEFKKINKEYKEALDNYDNHVDWMENKPTKQREKLIEKAKCDLITAIEDRAIIKTKRNKAKKRLNEAFYD